MDKVRAILLTELEEDPIVIKVLPQVLELAMPKPRYALKCMFKHKGPKHYKNQSYFEKTVPFYGLNDFKSHFRMSRSTVEIVHQTVSKQLQNVEHVVPLEKKVHFAIWMLSKRESFLAAGDRFGFNMGSAHSFFYQVVNAIADAVNEYIVWPTLTKQAVTAEVFKTRSGGFPGVVGVIGATHITIKQPHSKGNDYYNTYKTHSVILQGVCDEDCRFTNVSTGYPGRLHNARVLRNSEIGRQLMTEPDTLFPRQDTHLIGDAAYPLQTHLITRIQDNGHLTERQLNFNKKLSSVRLTIEQAFVHLKGKFQRLKLLEVSSLENVSKIVMASCVLHNIIIENEGFSDEEYPNEDEDRDNDVISINATQQVLEGGMAKINQIMENIPL